MEVADLVAPGDLALLDAEGMLENLDETIKSYEMGRLGPFCDDLCKALIAAGEDPAASRRAVNAFHRMVAVESRLRLLSRAAIAIDWAKDVRKRMEEEMRRWGYGPA